VISDNDSNQSNNHVKEEKHTRLLLVSLIILICVIALFEFEYMGNSTKTLDTELMAETDSSEGLDESVDSIADRPLIQTTSSKDEYQGLLHLGLLQTDTLYEENVERAIEAVKPCIVMIDTGEYYGSGIIIAMEDDAVYVVSNKHLLNRSDKPAVTFSNKKMAVGTLLGCSDEYDIGVVKVDIFGMLYSDWAQIRYANVNEVYFEDLKAGDMMFLVGSTDGVAQDVYQGTVLNPSEFFAEFSSYMIHNNCYGKKGMSGGGTFDAYGYLIGMTTGGLEDESASLPLDIILQEYTNIIGRQGE